MFRLTDLRVQIGKARKHVPAWQGATGQTQLEPLHALFPFQHQELCLRVSGTGIGLVDAEQRPLEAECVIEQSYFGADLKADVLFWRRIGIIGRQRQGFSGRIEGGIRRKIVAHRRSRTEDQASPPVHFGVRALKVLVVQVTVEICGEKIKTQATEEVQLGK